MTQVYTQTYTVPPYVVQGGETIDGTPLPGFCYGGQLENRKVYLNIIP